MCGVSFGALAVLDLWESVLVQSGIEDTHLHLLTTNLCHFNFTC